MRNLAGKTAFITGAASGIGRAMAEEFAEAGMRLVLTDIDADALRRTAADLRRAGADILARRHDVGRRADWRRIAEAAQARFGAIHLLCNNAGIAAPGWAIDELPEAAWDLVLRTDLTSCYYGIAAIVPSMRALPPDPDGLRGHVLNTASMSALRVMRHHAVYAAAKGGLIALSEAMRLDLAPAGIGVTVLCPGPVATAIGDTSARQRDAAHLPAASGVLQLPPGGIPPAREPRDVARAARAAIEANTLFLVTSGADIAKLVQARNDTLMRAFAASTQRGV